MNSLDGTEQIHKYMLNGSSKLVYNEKNDTNLHQVAWFVPFGGKPTTTKYSWRSSPKFVDSTTHSVKDYAPWFLY